MDKKLPHRLNAFEFASIQDGPQHVRLTRHGALVLQMWVITFSGVDLSGLEGLEFESTDDLVVEGVGMARPYWDDDRPTWTAGFDPAFEGRRVVALVEAVRREANARSLIVN